MSRARSAGHALVVFASHGVDPGGGAERCLLDVLDVLRHHSELALHAVVPSSGPFADSIAALGVPCDVMASPSWVTTAPDGFGRPSLTNLARRARMMRGVLRLSWPWVAHLRGLRPDLVVTNTAISPSAALAARVLRIPHVWWLHEFVREPGATGTLGLAGPDFALGQPLAARAIGRLSARVVATSQALAREFAPHLQRDQMLVIHPAIAVGGATPNALTPGAFHLLLLGRQTPAKGTELAVRALAVASRRTPGLSLRLVGSIDPAYKERIESLSRALAVDEQVAWFDYDTDPSQHFEWANTVMTCSARETFGRVVAEALVRGRPVIGTRAGGTQEIVADGVDGILVHPGDVDGLADAVVRLACDPALVHSMSERAIARTRGRFTTSAVEADFMEVIRVATIRRSS
jgi:glycosyltransferase involved in cell wall biosynthesis